MRRAQRKYKYVQKLRDEFEKRKNKIRARLAEFAEVSSEEYFYELAYCLLTPQSSAVNAEKAITALKTENYLDTEVDAASILYKKQHYIRFHNTKGKHLRELKTRFDDVRQHLCSGSTGAVLREWLVKNVKGLGWKEASHFLRNIGHRDLAILDRHILKNLKKHNVIRAVPKSLTAKRYFTIERKFMQFAAEVRVSMDELDLLFWSNETGEVLK